ncbi:MAG: prolyl-tRNA synthetase [Alphaproteobacteria bacterium]|nr:prolyl-tRNA synthetase [Alphaproteobacteria bacterium]
MAGAYTFLPLGNRVLAKIEQIIREEMDAIGGQEILMPALHPKEVWDRTNRWDALDVLFKLKGSGDKDYALGATHEEVVTPLAARYIDSYRDLPFAAYQIQTKFRNEPRAKSGILRGREFRMKDMYSFHVDQACLDEFYEQAKEAYIKIYDRLGIGHLTYYTYASGGTFSKYSHEFQTLNPYGEDEVYVIPGTKVAVNKEIIDDPAALKDAIPNYKPGDEKKLEVHKSIEVGNIFKLGTKFSDTFDASFNDEGGKTKSMVMGCYGIGPSRVMGTIAESLSDENGLVWPEAVAPYDVHLITLGKDENENAPCEKLYHDLKKAGIDVLYDDRIKARAGEKFSDADLIGIPTRVVMSKKTLETDSVEVKKRNSDETEMVKVSALIKRLK